MVGETHRFSYKAQREPEHPLFGGDRFLSRGAVFSVDYRHRTDEIESPGWDVFVTAVRTRARVLRDFKTTLAFI